MASLYDLGLVAFIGYNYMHRQHSLDYILGISFLGHIWTKIVLAILG